MKKILLLYVPVLHEGYLELLKKYHNQVDGFYLIGEDIVAEFAPFKKEIRALDTEVVQVLIQSLKLFPVIRIITKDNVNELRVGEIKDSEIITATDEICKKTAETYFSKNKITYDKAFLRWDEKNVQKANDVGYDRVSQDAFDREMCDAAVSESEKSSDWWRHVGAVVVKEGKIILGGYNHHLPSEHMPYIHGDPRDVIKAGTLNLVYTSLHAEQSIVAEAAKQGISLEGISMYLNIFPCPLCAKLMAAAGIKKCFFKDGAAWLDAESVLRAQGVEIILVQ